VVSFTPRPLYSQGKKPWYPLYRRLGGPQSCPGHGDEEKNSHPPPGIEPYNPDRPASKIISYVKYFQFRRRRTSEKANIKRKAALKACEKERCREVTALSYCGLDFEKNFPEIYEKKSRERMELNGTCQLLVYAGDMNLLLANMSVMKKNRNSC
jgi:hypothetical protein